MNLSVEVLRAKAVRCIALLMGLHVPLVILIALTRGADPVWPAASVAVLALMVQIVTVRRPGAVAGHVVLAFAYAAIIAIMVGQMQGHPWQADMHVYFFAGLAIISALCSWPAILAFVGFVAVHHLVLNFWVTSAVFNGPPDLFRVSLHAVILVSEGVLLGVLTYLLDRMFAQSAAGMVAAHEARLKAERLLADCLAAQVVQSQFLATLIAQISAIAEGDFQSQIAAGTFPAEHDAVCQSLNALCLRLNQTLDTVAEATSGIQIAGETLGTASLDLANGSQDQVATLNRATQAFRSLTGSLNATAQLATQADQVMIENRAEVERGTALLSDVVSAMGLIEQSTGQIRQIVEVMDNIAFQTNLLALNAGVEAARAGDSGRGFAVVAMEVRALAQRAAESARDIRRLIDQDQGNVALGTQKVGLTTSALQSLLGSASRAASLVSNISVQVKMQSQNLGEVHSEVAGLDGQARRNSGLASRIADAGADLQQYSGDLARGMDEMTGASRYSAPDPVRHAAWAA